MQYHGNSGACRSKYCRCQQFVETEAEARIAATQSGGAWVKCSDALPKEKSRVWFFKGCVRRGYYCSEGFFSEAGMGWAPEAVSHWMPCDSDPSPPKGDTDG